MKHWNEDERMFRCEQCGSHQFKLLVQPEMAKQLQLWVNENDDLLIQVGERAPFVADLGFMNRYATCEQCESSGQWAYWYETVEADSQV